MPIRFPVPSTDRSVTASGLAADDIVTGLQAREWSEGEAGRISLYLVRSRRASVEEGGAQSELMAPSLAWLPGGKARKVRFEAGTRGYRLSTPADAMAGALTSMPNAARLEPYRSLTILSGPVFAAHADEIAASFQAIMREVRLPGFGSDSLIAAHLAILCLHVLRLSGGGQVAKKPTLEAMGSLAQRFERLLELHLRSGWGVARYAETLGVTVDRLHAACIRSRNAPPSVLIRERLMAEARALLQNTDLPVEQIGYGLGFRDPAYFNRVCRAHLGTPPGRFRRDHAPPERRPGSYAAWP